MKQNISVVINTYNASKYLARVLDTVKGFDEVVVCDMESTDNTVAIAKEYHCNVITFPKADHKSAEPARTFAIQSAQSDWVLVVDADELVSEALRSYLYDFIKNPGEVRGLYIPRKNYTMNVCLPSSYPDYQLRFFMKEGTVWPPYVHTFPTVQGALDYIPKKRKDCAFDHLDDSTRACINRLNNYTDNEVEKRAFKKVTLFKLIASPMVRFLKQYFIKNPGEVRGLYIPRKNYTMNVCLPSSYPDYQLRFFMKEGTVWPPYVHTFPTVQGALDYIPKKRKDCAFDHLDDSTRACINRLNNYTDNEVEKRAFKKVTLFKLIASPMVRFLKQYFIKGGIFYGIPGYVQAMRSAQYKFTVLCKVYEQQVGIGA